MNFNRISQKLGYFISALLAGIPLVSAQGAGNPFVSSLLDILNSLAYIIGNDTEIAKVATGGVEPWQVVGLTFIFVTSIVTAGFKFVKVFENRGGATIAIGIIFGIAAAAAPGIMSIIWLASTWFIIITVIALLVFIGKTLWSSSSATSAGQSAAAANARRGMFEAQEGRDKAKHNKDIQRHLLDQESTELKQADAEINALAISGKNVESDLNAIADAIAKISRLGDEGQSLKAKEALNRKVGSISSKITGRKHSVTKIQQKISEINALLREEVKNATDTNAILTNLKMLHKNKTGADPVGAELNKASELAQTVFNIVKRQPEIINRLNTALAQVEDHDAKIQTALSNVVKNTYDNNYPQAVNAIQTALLENRNAVTAASKLKELDAELEAYVDKIKEYERYINKLTK